MLFALLSTLTAVHAKGVSIVLRSYAETAISGRSRVGRASSPRLLLEDPGPVPHHEDNVGVLDTTIDTFLAIYTTAAGVTTDKKYRGAAASAAFMPPLARQHARGDRRISPIAVLTPSAAVGSKVFFTPYKYMDNVVVVDTATDISTIASSASSSPSSLTECNLFKLPEARKKSKLARVGAVGTATTWRTIKTCLGLGSLWLGGTHWAEITLSNGWESCCTVEVTQAYILSAGTCHISTALMGLPRIKWNEREKARNAMIWPVPFQNMFLVGLCLSDYTQGVGAADAILSFQSPPMMTLAAANIAIGLWQTYSAYSLLGGEASPTKGFWFGGKMTNTAVVFVSYSGPFMLIAAFVLSLGVSSSHELAVYSDILKANPELRLLTLNIMMNTVFVNNVAVFFATLHRYQVLTSRQAAALYIFLVAAPVLKFICGFIACFDLNHGHEHELLLAWLSVFSHGLVGPHTHG